MAENTSEENNGVYRDLVKYGNEKLDDFFLEDEIEIKDSSGNTWTGVISVFIITKSDVVVGVSLEEVHEFGGNGKLGSLTLFECLPGHGLFIPLECCKSITQSDRQVLTSTAFEPILECMPMVPIERIDTVCGSSKGIQSHPNSSYMDATLCSMFLCNSVFDSILIRPRVPTDSINSQKVRRLLCEEIVNPLREHGFANYTAVVKLKEILDSATQTVSKNKDPSVFLSSILDNVLHEKPLLEYTNGESAYVFQLKVESNELSPTVQELMEKTMYFSKLKLNQTPKCLILQADNTEKEINSSERTVIPSGVLDVKYLIENVPKECYICGKLATSECLKCYESLQNYQSEVFCEDCTKTRQNVCNDHNPKELPKLSRYKTLKEIPKQEMKLFAIICKEKTHYSSFIKCGSGENARWLYFDQTSNENGPSETDSIPMISKLMQASEWFADDGESFLKNHPNLKEEPLAEKLFCKAHIYMYCRSE